MNSVPEAAVLSALGGDYNYWRLQYQLALEGGASDTTLVDLGRQVVRCRDEGTSAGVSPTANSDTDTTGSDEAVVPSQVARQDAPPVKLAVIA